MTTYRNPGIPLEEISFFQPSVVEVETALPAFVGYTAKATRKYAGDLRLTPTKISSMREFENLFGFPYENEVTIHVYNVGCDGFALSEIVESSLQYILYYSVKLYFDNGGGSCYIVSVDLYQRPQQVVLRKSAGTKLFGLLDGLDKLAEVDDLSLIVIPEAVKLSKPDYALLVQSVLLQCYTLGNRFSIFDLYNGDSIDPDLNHNCELFGRKYLNYGSAYYPFIKTTIHPYVNHEESNIRVTLAGESFGLDEIRQANMTLYKFAKKILRERYIVLPSCGAIAGTYATTDKMKGVWKSPTHLNLACVSELAVSNDILLNEVVHPDHESSRPVNSIRNVSGKMKGTFVWGARTLAGKEDEEEFVSVNRFIIMVKESIRSSTSWVTFERNDSETWTKIRNMIEKYLTRKWQDGALAGVTPQQAFYVNCGLDVSMTSRDIFEGILNIDIGLAILRPLEFFAIKISHQLRKVYCFPPGRKKPE
jgi:phage tail sheath protein FI